MNKVNFLFVFWGCIFSVYNLSSYSQVNFPLHSQFKYLKGSQASTLSNDWMSENFNDSNWTEGIAPFRYTDGEGGTVLNDMQYNYSTLYLRSTFNVSQVNSLKKIYFNVDYDDGFVVWINNQEVCRRNAPNILSYNAFAPDFRESGIPILIVIDSSDVLIHEGINTIAIQGFNCNLESSDFYFDIEFHALPALPESSFVHFSHASGFYESSFNLSLTASDTSTSILYTLDGSDPSTSQTAIESEDEVSISVDPLSSNNRPATPAFMVRATLAKDGFESSIPKTQTYIFIENVKTQQHPGGDWPNDNINDQDIDLEMDQDVVNNSLYSDSIDDALLDIPSISISTDLENLFDPSTGIYVNAWGHGKEWERPCSVELLNPDGSQGFQINAGLRIRGGWSRHPEFPKHSFRLFFRSQYGESKLNYPLFENEGVTEFDKIDLRTSQNYAWANWGGEHNTMVRDVFSRESQGATNQPYTRSRYYHLYLNGMYWGLFQSQERSEARYASDYFGGDKDDYDVIKVNTEDYVYDVEATDGSLETWEEIWNLCDAGFESNERYFILEGKNQYGLPITGSEILIDIDNLIDYMINIFYTGNFDSPTSAYGENQGPNNFYTIYNRNDKSNGFKFFVHDAEHVMMINPTGPGIGINENRVEPENMNVGDFYSFHPQWLHHKLTQNYEYRLRFADRALKHLKGKGIFTPGEGAKRFNERVQDLSIPIIAESARWGDSHSDYPYTKHNAWLPEIEDILENYFPYRTSIVINQLLDAGLMSNMQAPVVKQSGTPLDQDDYYLNGNISLTFENYNSNGIIYYTRSGDDPRLIGGSVSDKAIQIQSGAAIQINSSAIIKTRIYNGSSWSPVKTYKFYANNDDYSNLKVTELHYHPVEVIIGSDTISGKSYEFIEFLNIGETALNLSGLKLDSAVTFEFPNMTILPPKGFYVIATKPQYFYEAYGLVASSNCDGFFNNAGEYVLLSDSLGNEILSFSYDDEEPWPVLADGNGFSLTAGTKYPTGDPDNFEYWMPSSTKGGSPFTLDSLFTLNDHAPEFSAKSISLFPNPVKDVLRIDANMPADNQIHLQLYNGYGAIIYQARFNEYTEINFQSLNLVSGLYIVLIESGSYRYKQKIIYQP